jgi:hypothetical protein
VESQVNMTKYLSACIAVALLGGCAAFPDEWRLYGEGWRTGYVIETAPAAAITLHADSDCRLDHRIPLEPGQRFAVVLWATHKGVFKERVAAIASDSPVAKGDWVEVNIERCDAPVVRSHHVS